MMNKPNTTPFNTPAMLMLYTAISTSGCLTVPKAYAFAGWAGATALLAFVSIVIFCMIFTYLEVAKAQSKAQQCSAAVEEDTAHGSLVMPVVQALDAKMDTLCKHLGVKADS